MHLSHEMQNNLPSYYLSSTASFNLWHLSVFMQATNSPWDYIIC